MKFFIGFIFLLVSTFEGYSQQQISSTISNMQGSVEDAVTHNKIAGATIRYQGATTVSDAVGYFSIPCASAGRLYVAKDGYESQGIQVANCNGVYLIGLQPLSRDLDVVEVTANTSGNKSLLSQPASIGILKPRELKRATGLFLDEVVNSNVPGVTMTRRAVNSGQQFNIRGYGNGARRAGGLSSNFDGQGYKVYLNGIPVTDAEGITVMDDIDFGTIGKVEIVKGPAGTLYGLAIAGAVNLTTARRPTLGTTLGQEVLIGNYGLQRYTTSLVHEGEASSLLLNYGHQKSDGFTIHNASKKDFAQFAGNFRPSLKQTISTYFSFADSYDERSGELTISQYNNNDFSGNIEYIKRNAHSHVRTLRAGASHTYAFNGKIANTTTVFGTGFNSDASSAGGWTDKYSTNLGIRSTFDTKLNIDNTWSLTGITGTELQTQNAQITGYTMIKNPRDTASVWKVGNPYYYIIGASNSNQVTRNTTGSYFTEWTLAGPQRLSFTGGLGYSNMHITLDDRIYVANKPTHFDTTYRGMFSPHFAVNKVFNNKLSVYGSFSTGYKAPVSSYFFIPYNSAGGSQTGIVNNKLKPEHAVQYEVGTKGELLKNKLSYQLAFFLAQFKDKMTSVAVPLNSTTTLYTYVVNAGRQDNKGIEASLKYAIIDEGKKIFRNVSVFANTAYSDFKYRNYSLQTIGKTIATPVKDSAITTNLSGLRVAGVPKITANAGLDFSLNAGFYGNVVYMYRDGMAISSDGKNNTSSYNLLNAKLGYQRNLGIHFAIDLYAGASNITNTKYPIMVFINQLPDAYVAGPRKANYFGGLNLSYRF